MITRFLRDQQGATAIEYGLVAALIGVAVLGSVTAVGVAMQSTTTEVAKAVEGPGSVAANDGLAALDGDIAEKLKTMSDDEVIKYLQNEGWDKPAIKEYLAGREDQIREAGVEVSSGFKDRPVERIEEPVKVIEEAVLFDTTTDAYADVFDASPSLAYDATYTDAYTAKPTYGAYDQAFVNPYTAPASPVYDTTVSDVYVEPTTSPADGGSDATFVAAEPLQSKGSSTTSNTSVWGKIKRFFGF